mmetsp:Transcript_16060/g.55912  ORF Transcript_16060/g.55912 Transcript_16060/m.55912 type:complete len:310 (+) Transcript_16060:1009-1938(+)
MCNLLVSEFLHHVQLAHVEVGQPAAPRAEHEGERGRRLRKFRQRYPSRATAILVHVLQRELVVGAVHQRVPRDRRVVRVDCVHDAAAAVHDQGLQLHGDLRLGLARPRHRKAVPVPLERQTLDDGQLRGRHARDALRGARGALQVGVGARPLQFHRRPGARGASRHGDGRGVARVALARRQAIGLPRILLVVVHGLQLRPALAAQRLLPLLLLAGLAVLGGAGVEELGVPLHEHLQDLECASMHRRVPMLRGIVVQLADDDRELISAVCEYHLQELFALPHVKRLLRDVRVDVREAGGQAASEHRLEAL